MMRLSSALRYITITKMSIMAIIACGGATVNVGNALLCMELSDGGRIDVQDWKIGGSDTIRESVEEFLCWLTGRGEFSSYQKGNTSKSFLKINDIDFDLHKIYFSIYTLVLDLYVYYSDFVTII